MAQTNSSDPQPSDPTRRAEALPGETIPSTRAKSGLHVALSAVAVNLLLAIGKIVGGIVGNSYALVADGIESTADIFSSFIVWSGLRVSLKPPDSNHPYGHGKAESIAAVAVALILLLAALLIAVQSVREILTPHHAPEPFTLLILVGVIAIKETLFRFTFKIGSDLQSAALKGDAWHHRSDALTSAAAFIGITVALVGGPGFEPADDWAALVACAIIVWNGKRLLRTALDEIMDASVPEELVRIFRDIAAGAEGVIAIDKCRVRKNGLHFLMDIHVVVDGETTVRRGHAIGHNVKDRLLASQYRVTDVTVHVEPAPPSP